jgi:hypothetical protein
MPDPFPDRDALCESCGYALQTLRPDGDCPECGTPIDDSHPRHRTGPPWENLASLATWLATVRALARHPRQTFRRMRVDGSPMRPRSFLANAAILTAIAWCVSRALLILIVPGWMTSAGSGLDALRITLEALIVFWSAIWLTYIEAAGVWYFSRRRDWRLPWHMAERVTCYAAIGWVPTAVLFSFVWLTYRSGVVERLWATTFGSYPPCWTSPSWRSVTPSP